MRTAVWLVLALAPACVHDDLVSCGDALCPVGYTCDQDALVCVDPNGLSLPNQIEIASAACGAVATQQLAVRNTGTRSIAYSAVSDVAGVTVTPPRGTFAPGEVTQLALMASIPTASIPGEAVTGSLLFELDTNDVIRRPIAVTPAGALLDVSVHTLSFGESAIGDMATKQVAVTNHGNLDVSLAPSLGMQSPSDGSFLAPSTASVRVAPTETKLVPITFFPHQLGSYTSNLMLAADAPLCQAPLTPISIQGAATNEAILVDSLLLDFGDVACNAASGSLPLTITNKNATAQTLSFTLSGPDASAFAAVPDQSVPGNGMVTIPIQREVIASPQDVVGGKTATLELTATGATTTMKTIDLQLGLRASVIHVDAPCVPVDPLPPHSVTMIPISVSNTGNATASITASPRFNVSASPANFQIPANSSAMVTLLVANNTSLGMVVDGLLLINLNPGASSCTPLITLAACGFPL